ncbi:uncharacterized protein At2g29880-like [Cynara cardunculus var. scolymus]|uniref:uncharacterized protein At2g29880-like n=1 Tax=Cynara cardunculus var. scolymus TaxID=59895 RepID=UPI000D62F4A5|nr:uncharacterized protein At2g29880-like [Cynara cardunculus var. scolymus]
MADKINGCKYSNWSKIKDGKLIDALVNMVNVGGYKANNGFKSGYLQHLEQALKVSLPNSNLLGKPHIKLRIKTMEKDCQIVHDMLHGTNTSGFGYDSSKMCVTAEAPLWESYLQASKWRNKPFPHYEDLSFVFGKDRAHGNQARDYDGLEENVDMEDGQMPFQEQQSNENLDYSTEDSQMPSQECTSQGNRKRNKSR